MKTKGFFCHCTTCICSLQHTYVRVFVRSEKISKFHIKGNIRSMDTFRLAIGDSRSWRSFPPFVNQVFHGCANTRTRGTLMARAGGRVFREKASCQPGELACMFYILKLRIDRML